MNSSFHAICVYYKFGHCKYGERCRLKHVSTICEEENCQILQCEKRHQKQSRYFTQFGKCKFNSYCSYLHVTNTNDAVDKSPMKYDILKLTEKVASLEVLIEEKESKLRSLETEFELFKEENEKQKLEIKSIVEAFRKLQIW